MEHNSTFPIKQNELDMLRDEASGYLKSVQWEQSNRAKNKDKGAKDDSILLYLSRANSGSNVEITSVSKTILGLKKRLLPDSIAIPVYLNQTLYAVQEGITLGIWIKDNYYDLAFSLNDAGEWGSSYTPNKTLQNAMKKYISYDMKGKKKSYTFDEFITELSYAYKTFLHQDRIC